MKAMKKLLVLVLALATVICLAVPAFAADGYTDVNEKDWFAGAVEYATENGMMNGMGENLFQPATTSTRGMVVTILHRLDGEPKASVEVKFDDLKQDWYKAAIAWAYENGVVEGYSETKFGPEDVITREQLATMAYRYAVNYLGLDGSAAGDLSVFTDAAKVSTWAKDAMVWAIGEGLIKGYEDNTLNPQGQANRAELATILMRLDQNVVTHTHELEHVEAAEPTCHKRGNAEYWYCAGCDCYFTDAEGKYNIAYLSLVTPATDVLYQEAVEPCHANGTQEYWYCEKCDTVFADAACTVVTNRKNLTLVADEALVHVPAKAATCHTKGNVEYWYCETCDLVSTDAAGTLVSNFKNVTIPASDVIYQEAVEACHANGTLGYWYCESCDAVFTDAECTQLTNRKNLTLEADEELVHVEAVEATCHKNGNVEYWYCETCQLVSTNKEGTAVSNFKNVVIPATDLIYQEEIPACHLNGTQEYWYCEKCDTVFADAACTIVTNRKNLTLVADEELTHKKATESNCHQDGYLEHWYCETCKGVYLDAEGKQVSNIKNVTIPAEPLSYQEEVPACHKNGTREYWFCDTCDAVFADAQGTQLTNRKNLTLVADEELTHKKAAAPACHQPGNIEYWYCETCDAVYTDAAGTKLSNSKDVQIKAEVELVKFDEVPATCCENGMQAYWFCPECEIVFDLNLAVSNRQNLVIPVEPELTHVAAVAPTCETEGNVEHWYCAECGKAWLDKDQTKPIGILSAKLPVTHTVEHVAAVAPTCETQGNVEYWYCTECGTAWLNEGQTQQIAILSAKLPATHTVAHVEAVEATCFTTGNVEYWYCTECGTAWLNEGQTQQIAILSAKTPELEHEYNEDDFCPKCETYVPGHEENPIVIVPEEIQMPGGKLNGALINVPAGETVYFQARPYGMKVTLSMANELTVVAGEDTYTANRMGNIEMTFGAYEGLGAAPMIVFAITNASAEYDYENYLVFEELVFGTMDNPAELVIGENTAVVEAGSWGYYYTWTATDDGTLSVTMPTEGGWSLSMNNITRSTSTDYIDSSDVELIAANTQIAVEEGDEIMVVVCTYDPDNEWNVPAGEVVFTAAFVAAE